jgi:hypothetical protein
LNDRALWAIGLLAGAAAIGGGIWWYENAKGVSITATPGTMNVSVPKGQTLTVTLPSGSSWSGQLSFSGSGNLTGGTGSAPLIITNVQTGGTIALAWTDSSGNPQVATLTVTAA